jgi:quercetin dioxygenase-like cupin family protein
MLTARGSFDGVTLGLAMRQLIIVYLMSLAAAHAGELSVVRYEVLRASRPATATKHVKVWNIKQDAHIRVNLVEMTGELPLHKHPDAAHSLLVLSGKVRVLAGDLKTELVSGDFISIPAGMPHKYWALGGQALLVSTDAPYYDPKKTVQLEKPK